MMKKILPLILMFALSFGRFDSGLNMFGGSFGFSKNLEDESSQVYLSPKFGTFVSNNFLLEGGITYYKYEACYDYGVQICNKESETVMSFGARYFAGSIYFGAEYVGGLNYIISTPAGTNTIAGVNDLSDDDNEMIILKIGSMSPIAQNIYLDTGLWIQKYVDDDIDNDGIMNITSGISYFWR